jgi:hypothetical protein
LKGFVFQFSLGNDQYPKTLTTATDVLSNHKIDQKYYHERPTNDETSSNATSFAQRHEHEMTCYCHGKKVHLSPECGKRNTIPHEQRHVNQAMQHLQEGDGADDATDDTEYDDALTNGDESVQMT